jgi:hypothetical protein
MSFISLRARAVTRELAIAGARCFAQDAPDWVEQILAPHFADYNSMIGCAAVIRNRSHRRSIRHHASFRHRRWRSDRRFPHAPMRTPTSRGADARRGMTDIPRPRRDPAAPASQKNYRSFGNGIRIWAFPAGPQTLSNEVKRAIVELFP